jgi:hypothetical protein
MTEFFAVMIVNHIGPQPAHEIADVAREVGADLIVIGTRGHTPIAGLSLGSVTLRLLHVAPCPVLAVPAIATVRCHLANPRPAATPHRAARLNCPSRAAGVGNRVDRDRSRR